MNLQREVGFAIDNESRTAADLLCLGLGALQATGPSNDSYHLHLTLLSSGLERLAKLLLILESLFRNAPTPKTRDYSHNLTKLISSVTERCFDASYLQRPAALADKAFLSDDPLFRELLALLNDFGTGGRYHHLDIAAERPPPAGPSPEDRWRVIRDSTVPTPPVDFTPEQFDALYVAMNSVVTACIEMAVRALGRLLTMGSLSEVGKPFSAPFRHFITLRDSELGTFDYRQTPFVPAALLRLGR